MQLHIVLAWGVWIALLGCAQEPTKVSRSQPGAGSAPGNVGQPSNPSADAGAGTLPQTAEKDKATPPAPVDNTIPAGPTTAAITVATGPVSFDLASAKPALVGATFTATLTVNAAAGSVPASISFSGMALKTPANTGYVVYRPVLVRVTADGKEEQFPIGVNINVKVPKARSVPLAGLTSVSFQGIDTGAKIKMRFSALEPIADALLDGIPNFRDCKAPQNFTAVANALQSCKACHSGLFAYDFMDKDMATACGQNLKIIDRTLSPTGTVPNIPAGAHQGVNAGPVGTALGPWRTGEGL